MSSSAQQARQISGEGLPDGQVIASFSRYVDAQHAVDHLSDEEFDVSALSIVGHDLATLEKVTGRLTYPRVAMMAAGQGAFFGLFFGLILTLFGGGGPMAILLIVILGAAFWMLLGVISYAAQRGRRDFTSMSTIVATRYEVRARGDVAARAGAALQAAGIQGQAPRTGGTSGPAPAAPGAAAPGAPAGQERADAGAVPSRVDETPDGRPLYGVRVSEQEQDARRVDSAAAQGEPEAGSEAEPEDGRTPWEQGERRG